MLSLGLKKKKFHFDVTFTLQELLNCTYVTGQLFAKVRLKDGAFSTHSRRMEVQKHQVTWHQELKFSCKLYASVSSGALEPCICKVSVKKETKGGRSYSKLGYVDVNLAEYAGAGLTQRKYLLQSYSEHKQRTDNSILKVSVCMKQTSGDVVFKAPQPPKLELHGEDEEDSNGGAIQRTPSSAAFSGLPPTPTTGLTFAPSGLPPAPTGLAPSGSTCVTSSGLTFVDTSLRMGEGGSIQTKGSASGLAQDNGTVSESDTEKAAVRQNGSHCSISGEGTRQEPRSLLSLASDGSSGASGGGSCCTSMQELKATLGQERSNSLDHGDLAGGPHSNNTLPLLRTHKRGASLGVLNNGSPSHHMGGRGSHVKQNSLVVGGCVRAESSQDTESVCSSKSRSSLFPSARVEQSRVDAKMVVDELFESHDFVQHEEEGGNSLKMYMDVNGEITVGDHTTERINRNLKPIEMAQVEGRARSNRKMHKQRTSLDAAPG